MVVGVRTDVYEGLLVVEPPAFEECLVGWQRPQEVGVDAVRQERDLRARNASALEVLDEAMRDRGYVPRLPEEEVFELLHDRQHPLAPYKTQLTGHVYLQIGDVVDVRHAAQPLHQEGNDTKRQRLRLDKHSVRLPTQQRGHKRCGGEAEIVRQPHRSGVARRRIQPRATDRDVVDRLADPQAAAILGELDARRIIRHAREDLDLDALAPKLACESPEPELWCAELRSVVLGQDHPSLAPLYHEIPQGTMRFEAVAAESMLTRSITRVLLRRRTASLNSGRR